MTASIATGALILAGLYVLAGFIALIPLQMRGLPRIDPSLQEPDPLFRALIAPGIIALWPLLCYRWARASAHMGEAAQPGSESHSKGHFAFMAILLLLSPGIAAAPLYLNGGAVSLDHVPSNISGTFFWAQEGYDYGRIFSTLPARAIGGRNQDKLPGVFFRFREDRPFVPVAFFWAPEAQASDALPPGAQFKGLVFGPDDLWFEIEGQNTGYWITYNFVTRRVEIFSLDTGSGLWNP